MQKASGIVILSTLVICAFAYAQYPIAPALYIPNDDPLTGRLLELQARGYLPSLSQSERPWLAADVIIAIEQAPPILDPYYTKMADEILHALQPASGNLSDGTSASLEGRLDLRGFSRERREGYFYWRDQFTNRNFKGELGSVYNARFSISESNRWGIDTRLLFDSDGLGYPWYYGTRHNARIIGQFDHAYATFQGQWFDLFLGRQRLIWGPSPRGSLLLDASSPPMDMLYYSFTLNPFRLSAFMSRLDDYFDPGAGQWNRRFISGHRLNVAPGKGWEAAFSEIYVYGGAERLPELYYNIPIILYYWEQQNRSLDDNAFWAADLSWTGSKLGRFYFQFIADDIQRQHRGPQKFAWQFGSYLTPSVWPGWSALIEINIVDTYVFGQRKRVNAYLNWNHPLGRLDSDQREYFAGAYKQLGYNIKLGAEFIGREKGEYDAVDMQPNMAPFDTPFPSGVVEKSKIAQLLFNWHRGHLYDVRLSPGYQIVDNFERQPDREFKQFFITAQASLGLNLGLPLWKKSR